LVNLIIVDDVQRACVQIIKFLQSISHKLEPFLPEIPSFNVIIKFGHDFLGLFRLVYAFLLQVDQAFLYLLFLLVSEVKVGIRFKILTLDHF